MPRSTRPLCYLRVSREIIDKAQEMLFVKAKGKAGNMITCGYRMVRVHLHCYSCSWGSVLTQSSHNGDVGKHGRYGITNLFVNTIITALKAPEWETLLQRSVSYPHPSRWNLLDAKKAPTE